MRKSERNMFGRVIRRLRGYGWTFKYIGTIFDLSGEGAEYYLKKLNFMVR